MPEVSVIIPTRNRKSLLALSLRSALGQRDVDLEVIVVNDGSTDGTDKAMAELGDERVHTIRNDLAQGVSVARNRGIHLARGRWIAFLDDDDLWAPDKLSAQLDSVRKEGRGWCYTGSVDFSGGLRAIGGAPPSSPEEVMVRLWAVNSVPGGGSRVLVKRELLAISGGFDPGLRPLADWDLWIRIARHDTPACVARPLVGYRVHPGNMSLDLPLMRWELALLERRHGIRVDMASFYRYCARLCLRSGQSGRSMAYLSRAATKDRNYLKGAFRSDAIGILRVETQRFRRSRTAPRSDPLAVGDSDHERQLRAWRREAQGWLDDLRTEDGKEPR